MNWQTKRWTENLDFSYILSIIRIPTTEEEEPTMVPWLIGIAVVFVVYIAMTLARKATWAMGFGRHTDHEFKGTLAVVAVGLLVTYLGGHYFGDLAGIFGFIGMLAYIGNRWFPDN